MVVKASAPRGGGVSVILTVLDERASVERLLDSLTSQTLLPSEIVVVDGGSRDGTLQCLEARAASMPVPMVVLSRPGANISAGRNAAIEIAQGPWIAATDAGVRLEAGWLESLTAPLSAGVARVASGFFASDPSGAFETALGAATLPVARDVDPASFLPSSRSVAFEKALWREVGGYPEWLDFCEDLVFDMRLLDRSGGAVFVPEAVARFRPRPSLRAFARQYYLYARGDGKADLWRARHAARYVTYLVALPALLSLAVVHHWLWLTPLVVGAAFRLRRPWDRLRQQWRELSAVGRVAATAWLPVIVLTGDVAKMVGYPAGWVWRMRKRPPLWRPVRGTRRSVAAASDEPGAPQ